MNVPFIDLKLRYQEEREEILRCVDTVLSQGHLIMTEEVDLFEREAASYIGSKHVVSLNSGTDALMMGLWALGIKKPQPREDAARKWEIYRNLLLGCRDIGAAAFLAIFAFFGCRNTAGVIAGLTGFFSLQIALSFLRDRSICSGSQAST